MKTLRTKIEQSIPILKKELGLSNNLAVPRLLKVVLNAGVGRARDKKRNELVADRLAKISGQRPSLRGAKQSIATFKIRQGDVVGVAVTLRGKRMESFLDRFINVAIPRTRDFKGYDEKSVDEIGNITVAVREHIVFPETSDEELKDVFGFAVTIVTTAKNRTEAIALLKAIGFPFKKKA